MLKELNHDGVSSTSEFDVTMDKFVTKADKNQAKNIKNTLYQTASTLDSGFTFVKNLYSDEKARRNYETRLQALCQKLERREWFDTFMLLVVIVSVFVLLFLDTQDECRDLGARGLKRRKIAQHRPRVPALQLLRQRSTPRRGARCGGV